MLRQHVRLVFSKILSRTSMQGILIKGVWYRYTWSSGQSVVIPTSMLSVEGQKSPTTRRAYNTEGVIQRTFVLLIKPTVVKDWVSTRIFQRKQETHDLQTTLTRIHETCHRWWVDCSILSIDYTMPFCRGYFLLCMQYSSQKIPTCRKYRPSHHSRAQHM